MKKKKDRKNKFFTQKELGIEKQFHSIGTKVVPRLTFRNHTFVRYKKNRYLKRDKCYVDIYRCKTYSELSYKDKEKCNATIWERLAPKNISDPNATGMNIPDDFYCIKKPEHVCIKGKQTTMKFGMKVNEIMLPNMYTDMKATPLDFISSQTLQNDEYSPNSEIHDLSGHDDSKNNSESEDLFTNSSESDDNRGNFYSNPLSPLLDKDIFNDEEVEEEDHVEIVSDKNKPKEIVLGPRKRRKRSRDPYQELSLENERDYCVSYTRSSNNSNLMIQNDHINNNANWTKNFNSVMNSMRRISVNAVLPSRGSVIGYDYVEIFFSFLNVKYEIIPLLFCPHLSCHNLQVLFGKKVCEMQCVNLTRNSSAIENKIKQKYGKNMYEICKFKSQLYVLVKNPPNHSGFVDVSMRYVNFINNKKNEIFDMMNRAFEYVDQDSNPPKKMLEEDLEEDDGNEFDDYNLDDILKMNTNSFIDDLNGNDGELSPKSDFEVNFFDMFLLHLFNNNKEAVKFDSQSKSRVYSFNKLNRNTLKRVITQLSTKCDVFGHDLMVHSIARNMKWLVKLLLDENIEYEGREKDVFGNNYYHWAHFYERKEIIEMLKTHGMEGKRDLNSANLNPKQFTLENLSTFVSHKEKTKKNIMMEKQKEEVTSKKSTSNLEDGHKKKEKKIRNSALDDDVIMLFRKHTSNTFYHVATGLSNLLSMRISLKSLTFLFSLVAMFVIFGLSVRHFQLKRDLLNAEQENAMLKKDLKMMEMKYSMSCDYTSKLEEERNAFWNNLQATKESELERERERERERGLVERKKIEAADVVEVDMDRVNEMDKENKKLKGENEKLSRRVQMLEWNNVTLNADYLRIKNKKDSYKGKFLELNEKAKNLEIENAVLKIENERNREFIGDLKDMATAVVLTALFVSVVMYFAFTTSRKNYKTTSREETNNLRGLVTVN